MKKKLLMCAMAVSAALMMFSCNGQSESITESTIQQTTEDIVSDLYISRMDVSADMDIRSIYPIGNGRYALFGTGETGNIDCCLTDSSFGSFEKLDLGIKKPENGEVTAIGSAAPDGKIYILVKTADYGDNKMPDVSDPDFSAENFNYKSLYSNVSYGYELITADETGVTARTSIEEKSEYISTENGADYGIDFVDILALNGGRILVRINIYNDDSQHYAIIGEDGKFSDTDIPDDIFNGSLIYDGENISALSEDENETLMIKRFDSENLKLKKSLEITGQTDEFRNVKLMHGADGYEYYIISDKSLYGIGSDGTDEKITDWIESGIDGNDIRAGIPSGDGSFILFIKGISDTGGFYRLERRDSSEISDITISAGLVYQSSNVIDMVKDFNMNNEGIRINIIDYSKYDNYEKGESGEEQFRLDILSGKAPDMVICGGTNLINSLSSEGFFADLYEYLDNGESLGRDDILPNIIEAGQVNGKLYSLSPTFYVNTLAAKRKFINKENWTFDEMEDAYNSMPENMKFMSRNNTKVNIFNILCMGMDFADISDNSSVSDSAGLGKLLEFCDNFDETDMTEYSFEESETAVHDDKALICAESFASPFDYAHMRYADFGEEISFVGYPSEDGRGGILKPCECFAIMENSRNKDACWEFISSFFSDDFYEKNESTITGFVSYRPAFEKQLDTAMKKPYEIIGGEKRERDDFAYYSGEMMKIDPISQEERNRFAEYLVSAKPFTGYTDEIYSIIRKKAEDFFKDEKD